MAVKRSKKADETKTKDILSSADLVDEDEEERVQDVIERPTADADEEHVTEDTESDVDAEGRRIPDPIGELLASTERHTPPHLNDNVPRSMGNTLETKGKDRKVPDNLNVERPRVKPEITLDVETDKYKDSGEERRTPNLNPDRKKAPGGLPWPELKREIKQTIRDSRWCRENRIHAVDVNRNWMNLEDRGGSIVARIRNDRSVNVVYRNKLLITLRKNPRIRRYFR